VRHESGSPSVDTSLYKISDLNRAPELWLAAHLEYAKEGVNVYTADHVRYLSPINQKSSTASQRQLKFSTRMKSQVQWVLIYSSAAFFEVAVIRRVMVAYAPR
jgi:hypothetical protein